MPLLAALASALAAAHAGHVLHRDVKPGNVLLGRDGAIKLTEFGIASFVSSRMAGAVFGTPGYLPPEALRGQGAGPAGDLFALGVVAYRCLTGRAPFEGRTAAEILTNTLKGRMPPLREFGAEAPPELEAIVDALLEPEPDRRIADAALLAAELARMSAFWGWCWTMNELNMPRPGALASDVLHAQVLPTIGPNTRPIR